jgi:hypothetical protein
VRGRSIIVLVVAMVVATLAATAAAARPEYHHAQPSLSTADQARLSEFVLNVSGKANLLGSPGRVKVTPNSVYWSWGRTFADAGWLGQIVRSNAAEVGSRFQEFLARPDMPLVPAARNGLLAAVARDGGFNDFYQRQIAFLANTKGFSGIAQLAQSRILSTASRSAVAAEYSRVGCSLMAVAVGAAVVGSFFVPPASPAFLGFAVSALGGAAGMAFNDCFRGVKLP